MEKQITLTLPESKARILMNEAYNRMTELDLIFEKRSLEKRQQQPTGLEEQNASEALKRIKNTANVMEEVFEDLRAKIYS